MGLTTQPKRTTSFERASGPRRAKRVNSNPWDSPLDDDDDDDLESEQYMTAGNRSAVSMTKSAPKLKHGFGRLPDPDGTLSKQLSTNAANFP